MALTVSEIMAAVMSNTISQADGEKQIAELMAAASKPAKAKADGPRKATIRVSDAVRKDAKTGKEKPPSGALVIKLPSQIQYPTTLYAGQLLDMAEFMDTALRFLRDNIDTVSLYDERTREEKADILRRLDVLLNPVLAAKAA